MDKRGFMFGLTLVFVTLFLSVSVILLYIHGQGNSDNSLVSPKVVLEIRDELALFEMREEELIRKSLVSAEGVFPEKGFRDSFRELFFDGFMGYEKMRGFLFDDLESFGGVNIGTGNKDRELLEDGIYPIELTGEKDGGIVFGRVVVGKKGRNLEARDESKINFPVWFEFEFGRSYVLTYDGSKFLVEGE